MKTKYKKWEDSFFSGLWLEVQGKMFPEAQTKEQVKFIIDVNQEFP